MEDSSKRRHLEEENDEDSSVDHKRIRGPAGVDIGSKLIKMIAKVEENLNGTLEATLSELSEVLHENLEPYEGQIIDILCECAMYLPEKITTYTTLIGLLNAKSSEFGKNVIDKLVHHVNECLRKEEYDIVLRVTTFLTDLGNVFTLSAESILRFLKAFVDLAVEENVRSDYFVYVTLHCLPWIGAELSEKKPQELDELLAQIDVYLRKREKLQTKMLQVWLSADPHLQVDYLDSLWVQINKLRNDNWLEQHIVRVYIAFKPILSTAVVHELPCVDPLQIQENKNMPVPRVVFRLFDPSDCAMHNQSRHPAPVLEDVDDPGLAAATSIERFLVEEDLNWIIDNNYLDWRLCAKILLNYHRRDSVALAHAIIEVGFGQLFRLPAAPHLEIFYGALFIELCRLKPDSFPQVLAQATEFLYRRTDTMQPICLDRFVNWFAYHLSNFQYRWSWSDWADCIELDSLHPHKIFVREVIEKCLRLAYHKKVLEFLPPEFHAIVPPEPAIIDICSDLPSAEAQTLADELQALIRAKKPDEVLRLLRKDPFVEDSPFNADSVAIFTAVLLKIASKTFSHSFTALTKYHKIFRTIVQGSEEMQSTILRTLYECWNLHKQMMTILVDKMLKMQIVDPAIVQAWVFSEEMKREFKRSWVWDVLNTAIRRLECHCAKLARVQNDLMQQIERAKKRVGEASAVAKKVDSVKSENGCAADGDAVEMDTMEVDVHLDMDELENANEDDKHQLDELEKAAAENAAALEELEDNLRNIFLNICHKFTLILTEHLLNCETDGTDVETDFFNYVSGRFRHIFLAHMESIWKYADDLDRELFSSPTVEPKIVEIFNQFRALKC